MILRKYIRNILSEMSTRYKRETGRNFPKWYETFGEYAQQDGLFVHFSDFPKLGLFPQNRYDTPTGFYAYYLDTDKIADFGIDRRYAVIFRPKTGINILDVDAYDDDDYLYDLDQLTDHPEYGKHMTHHLISSASRDARIQIPAGKIWNITRVLSNVVGKGKSAKPNEGDLERDKERRRLQSWALTYIKRHGSRKKALDAHGSLDPSSRPGWDDEHNMLRNIPSGLTEDDIESEEKRNAESTINYNANEWSRILMSLGYNGVVDDGFEVIHENEPHQAVFFSVDSLELVDILDKREDIDEYDVHGKFDELNTSKSSARSSFEGDELSQKNFNGFDFTDSNFRRVTANSVQANNTNFSGCDFSSSSFVNLNARHSQFPHSVWIGTLVKGSNFTNSNFEGSNADSTTFRSSTFDGASFAGANLVDSGIFSSGLKNVNFSGATLSDFVIFLHKNEDLSTCNFSGVTFNNVRITSASGKTVKIYDSWVNSQNVRLEIRTSPSGKEKIYEI